MTGIKGSNYYEGILQLRNCTKDAVIFVRNKIKKEEGVWIAKEAEVKGGTDIYLSSNKFLKKVAKQLKERFQGIMKASSKLYTVNKQTGKKVYRGTMLFRMPSFRKGNMGIFKGDKVKILSIGDKVMLQDTMTGKKRQCKFEEVDKSFRVL